MYQWKSSSIPQVVLEVGRKPAEGIWYVLRTTGVLEGRKKKFTCQPVHLAKEANKKNNSNIKVSGK